MHYVNVKKALNQKNGLNIYRGCLHGCIYCDSRSKCYQMNHLFEDIEIKQNVIDLLAIELKKKRKKIMVGTGSMSDPYLPLEKELKMTQQMLSLINENKMGVHLLTKSTLVLRDIELLKSINTHSKVIVAMTLTTMDETLSKVIEPNVSTTFERIKALNILHNVGIETGVWLDPFLPFINDDYENFICLLKACVDAKVSYILCFGIGLTLREGNREYFYLKLDECFPGLKEKYIKTYGNSYQVTSQNNDRFMKILYGICNKYHIMSNPNEIFDYISS